MCVNLQFLVSLLRKTSSILLSSSSSNSSSSSIFGVGWSGPSRLVLSIAAFSVPQKLLSSIKNRNLGLRAFEPAMSSSLWSGGRRRDFCGLAAAFERDSFEEKTLKEEKHNYDGKH